MSNKLIVLFLMAMAAATAQGPAPPAVDFIAPELKAYLKLDATQVKTINGLIGDYYASVNSMLSDYMDLQHQIDTLRHDGTMDPQAIPLALVDPTAAEITIERKLATLLTTTEKAVQATLNPAQTTLTAQFSAAPKLQPLIGEAFAAFILSESERPSNSTHVNADASPLSLRSVFGKQLAAARKQRARSGRLSAADLADLWSAECRPLVSARRRHSTLNRISNLVRSYIAADALGF